ncbi:reverse transcriptase domain-containing protein [Tanacetum coccineum]
MSSPNHSTSDIEDAFSSMNILNYTSVSSDYFSASSESSCFNFLENSNIIPSVVLPLYNNPYLKNVQAFYAKELPISSPDPITPPAILTPSPVLPPSLLFDPSEGGGMPPKRTLTSKTPAVTLDAIRQLIADFTAALEAQTAAMPMGIEQANQITWTELKRLLTSKYCPRTEIKKMEDEFYGLIVNGSDLKTYIRRFLELAVLCPNMVPNTEKLMEAFIGGLPQSIEENVTASKPQTLEEATNISHRLMDQIIKRNSEQRNQ